MDRGAPLDADRALTSARPHLAAADEGSALLLLAEAKQEVGDWSQSLILLEELRELGGDADLETCLVLRAEAELHLGQETYVRQPSTQQALRQAAVNAKAEMTRARALSVLAALAYRGRDRLEARTLMALEGRQLPFATAVATQQRFLTLAMLHALVGDLATGRQFATQAVELSDRENLRSSRAALALNGLGAINSAAGDFAEAIRWFSQAYRAAGALDNGTLKLRSAANLALSHSYIGDWKGTVEWGETALALRGPTFGGHAEIMNAYHTAFAYASLQRAHEAMELLDATDARLGIEAPKWLNQVVLLQRADVLWITGKRKNAIDAATQAIRGFGFALLSVSYAGIFARWVALAAGQTIDLADARHAIAPLLAELDTFDLADQLEVLRSQQALSVRQQRQAKVRNGRSVAAIDVQISRLAASLPSGLNQRLKRLGFA
jgi:tetratricopeptide (TPR) repeat protein